MTETAASTQQSVTSSETKPRVLVVDDVEDNRDILTRRLNRRGFAAEGASDGPSALSMIDTKSYDVVLLDWMMPGMSGLEVLDAIRERHSKTALPVLMATAKTESEAVVEALGHGANDYVNKPIDFPILVARLEAQLSMREEATAEKAEVVDARDGIAPGTVIDGRYEIGDKIGEGGFAAVYRAKQISTGQTVAFKLLLPQRARKSAGDVEIARFLREMEVIANIEHPGVVRLIDSGQVEIIHDDYGSAPSSRSSGTLETVAERQVGKSGTQRSGDNEESGEVGAVPYIVMEFLDGRALSELLEQEAPLSVEETCDLAIPILSALGAAHDKGIVHRDVKPHNVLLVQDHRGRRVPKVLDFGIAKITERGVDDLTQSDSFIGTPEYMSPEQGRGKKDVDGRADLFSVGAVMYRAVTGRKLYDEESFLAMIHAVAAAEFPTPSELGCDLPADFEAVLLAALARDRKDRQRTVIELARELLPFASGPVRRRYEDELADPVDREAATIPAPTSREAPQSSASVDPDSSTLQSEVPTLARSSGEVAGGGEADPDTERDDPRAFEDTHDIASAPPSKASQEHSSSPKQSQALVMVLLVVLAVAGFFLMR